MQQKIKSDHICFSKKKSTITSFVSSIEMTSYKRLSDFDNCSICDIEDADSIASISRQIAINRFSQVDSHTNNIDLIILFYSQNIRQQESPLGEHQILWIRHGLYPRW